MIIPRQLEPRILSAASWYAIQTRYRSESKVSALLQSQGMETFLPVLEEIHHWSDREMPVNIPLFSGYGFVRVILSAGSRLGVLRTKGVIRFVNFGGEAVPIPLTQIDDLRMLLLQKVPCTLHAFLKIGQRVRIRGDACMAWRASSNRTTRKNWSYQLSLSSVRFPSRSPGTN